MRVAAFQNGYFTALCNRVGKEDCLDFAGESFVCGPDGEVIARGAKSQDEILYAEIDYAKLARIQRATVVPEAPPARAVWRLACESSHGTRSLSTESNSFVFRASVVPRESLLVTARTDRTPRAASRARSTARLVAARADPEIRLLGDRPVLAIGAIPELDRILEHEVRLRDLVGMEVPFGDQPRAVRQSCGQIVIVIM